MKNIESNMKRKLSHQLFQEGLERVPGGVHSPVRSFKGLPLTPLFVKSAKGAKIETVDGESFIDFCQSFGPLILGHQDPDVKEAIISALDRGWSYGASEPYSLELVRFLQERIPFAQQIRFVSSGTEAVMTALRLARGYTGRAKILKFEGCYHGHTDSMLIKSGSGLAGTHEASSAGIPQGVIQDTLVAKLGDEAGVKKLFQDYGPEIAAVIIEPLPANYGLLVQNPAFLHFLREITLHHGALLIFDEVISGLRIGFQGMSGQLNITPDLVTYGKIIGGGMPVGGIAGRAEVMAKLSPLGNVYQAGTLSANPVAMAAGLATLKKLTPDFYSRLQTQSDRIVSLFRRYLSSHRVVSYGSLFWFTMENNEAFEKIFMDFLERGIYLAPNGYEVGFVSIAHDETVIQELACALGLQNLPRA